MSNDTTTSAARALAPRDAVRHARHDEHHDGGAAAVRRYFGIVRKHRLLILCCTIAAAALALVLTLLTEPVYDARTTFEVQRAAPRVLDVNAADAAPAGSDEAFQQTQFAFIKSRALAAGIVQRLHLDTNAAFAGAPVPALSDANSASVAAVTRQRRIDASTAKVMQNIEVAPYGTSSVIELHYKNSDPRLAATVANAAVDEFIESTIQRQDSASSYARVFVGGRLNELKGKLEASERDLVNYAAQNKIVSVTDAKTGGGQSLDSATMVALNDRVATARANRILAQQTWQMAQSPLGNALPEIRDNAPLNQLTAQLGTLQADYQQKRATFKPNFQPMVQLSTQIAAVRAQVDALRGRAVQGMKASYDLAREQEGALQAQLDGLKGSVLNLQNRSIQYMILQREVDTNRALYDALLQRYKEIGVAGGSGSNNVSIVDRARAPGTPSSPILWLNLLLAVVGGLALGVAAAFIIELVDDTIKAPEDVEGKLRLPLLGVTPAIDTAAITEQLADKRSSITEAYYAIQTSLQLSASGGLPRSLLVTSAGMAEGKSTTSAALAQGFADRGKRVLLIDADLRRPTLHRRFGQPNLAGFSNVLTGEIQARAATVRLDDLGFDLIPSGPLPPNPAQLLSTGLPTHLDAITADYDIVILDGPPVLGLADAPLLADVAEATALVIEAGKSRRGAVRNALRRLGDARGLLAGVVLSKFNARTAGYGYSDEYSTYYYSYGKE